MTPEELDAHEEDAAIAIDGTTHWEGCWNQHYACSVGRLVVEVKRLKAERAALVDKILERHERLSLHPSTRGPRLMGELGALGWFLDAMGEGA